MNHVPHMVLPYQAEVVDQDIDLARLRPSKSYDYLIENRNASLTDLLADDVALSACLSDRPCPVCAADNPRPLFSKDSMTVVACEGCTAVYVNPVLDEKKYHEMYRSTDYQEIVKRLGEESHEYRMTRFGTERMDAIEQYHNSALPKRMLDVGCSTGFVIEEAGNRGWDAQGIELNPSAAAFARARGLRVFEIPLKDFSADQPFAAVGLYDVLEHLVDPRATLRRVHDLLHDDGIVCVYVPNFNCASRRLLGEQNVHFVWPTHHLTYFTPRTLTDFVTRSGFRVEAWETQGLDLHDWQWYLQEKANCDTTLLRENLDTLQFYINASGHGKNLRMYARKVSA